MNAQSGPYGIRRMALQLEMTDGRIMTFYAGETHAAEHGASVEIENMVEEPILPHRPPGQNYQIRVKSLGGYIMTLRAPRPDVDELLQPVKELEP